MGTFNNYFHKHHPTIKDTPESNKLLEFPMSTSLLTERIKNLLKRYNFSDKIIPEISSSLSKYHADKKNYNEEIKLTLKNQGDTDESKILKIILNGVMDSNGSVEYTIGAMVNTPNNCSVFKGTTIKTKQEINYYLNSLLKKLKQNAGKK